MNEEIWQKRRPFKRGVEANLKTELEIRHLHEKFDHLLINQWHKLLEIQEIQIELMEELAHKKTKKLVKIKIASL